MTVMRLSRLRMPLCALLAASTACAFGASPPDPAPADQSQYVTREQYDKLVHRLDEVTRKLNTLEKNSATKAQTDEYLQQLHQEMLDVKNATAQHAGGSTHFTVVGDASVTYTDQRGSNSSFGVGIAPLFLWQLDKRTLVEAGFDVGVDGYGGDASTSLDLAIANISYNVNDFLTVGGGLFTTPFGIFHNHLDPAWIYKLPDAPMAWDDGGIAPDGTIGAFANGAFPVGKLGDFTYDFYVGNGSALSFDSGNEGGLTFSTYTDNNSSKSVGGRISYLPIPSVEIGYSFNVGRVNPSGFTNTTGIVQGVDFTFKKDIPQIYGTVDFRTEWLWSHVSERTYMTDSGPLAYGNNRYGGYVQLAYRPTDIHNKIISRAEIVGRYDMIRQPKLAPGTYNANRYTVGLDYWFAPSSVLEAAYEWYTNTDGEANPNGFLVSYGIGF